MCSGPGLATQQILGAQRSVATLFLVALLIGFQEEISSVACTIFSGRAHWGDDL